MAIQTRKIAAANGGLVDLSITFDDVSREIQSLVMVNDAGGTVTITLRDPATQIPVFGPLSRTPGQGTFTQNLAPAHLEMVPKTYTNRDGTRVVLELPFSVTIGWTA